mmetsp:Transcript_3113/g.3680  ORF Transcript_3113/g.3680 Transcript_3113/m.3680 type:complete len:1362 (+) Transcript_3113:138-4223(+)
MSSLFSSMSGGALMIPSLLLLPAIFAVLLGIGWTRENIIEDSIYKIWTDTGSDHYKNKQYAEDVGARGRSTSFLAMATSRDSTNILSGEKLEEIRQRMEAVETVKVEHDGNTFTWKDICALNNIGLGTVYEFPCVRLTPMDFFQESSWFVTEKDRLSWYEKGIKANIVTPRIARFGTMVNYCSTSNGGTNDKCDKIVNLRFSPKYAEAMGYGAEYANPLALFSDLTAMEMNHECRECIESTSEANLAQLTGGTKQLFGHMAIMLNASLDSLSRSTTPDEAKISKIKSVLAKVSKILTKINGAAIEELVVYLTTRNLYATLGVTGYAKNKPAVCTPFVPACPDTDPMAQLKDHADSPFSSHNTRGFPYPIFAEDDTMGNLYTGNSSFGGSGIDLSGTALQMAAYFGKSPAGGPPLFSNGMADPDDPAWKLYVGGDPVYKWFMAGETSMTSHCGDEEFSSLGFAQKGCTKFSEPLVDEERTEQHFAKMWYDIVIDSNAFLNIEQGVSDPYSWTSGQGCEYYLKGERFSYTNQTETEIIKATSNPLYYIDEGVSIGALDKSLLMGGIDGGGNVSTIQTIYPALQPKYIPDRVRNCNRPGGPINITEADAEVVLELFKQDMVDAWTEGWDDDDDGKVQFVGFFDDSGVGGTFSFVLRDITDDNGKLTAISIGLIAAVSVLFLASLDAVESRIMITLVGVLLVILSLFGALGFGILIGIKININIAWTLPFIIIGLGVDDMYIVLLALKQQNGYNKENFVAAMKEIIIPVSMTSLVNASMFAVMNISNIGAIYKTAQAALISVIFLYLTIVFCFPAYCYLDMKRQQARRCDVVFCRKAKKNENNFDCSTFLFKKIYKPLVLGGGWFSFGFQAFAVLSTLALFGVGIYGITNYTKGLGLQEFFPDTHQASRWAGIRAVELASWSIGVSWGALNYSDPEEQMRMIKQYEDIVSTPHISKTATDTKWLWIADFNLWTTSQCEANFGRADPDVKKCGKDQIFPIDNTTCSGTWKNNTLLLKLKTFNDPRDVCKTFEDGICRPKDEMFEDDLIGTSASDTSFCPVFEGSEAKFEFCLEKWREHTGGGGGLLVEKDTATPYEDCAGEYYSDDKITFPIAYSASPSVFANDLTSHKETIDMIEETRKYCEKADEGLHECWMTGIPFDYWEQYLDVETVLLTITCTSIAVGFAVATLFLLVTLMMSPHGHSAKKIVVASVVGGLLIAMTSILCVIPVIGISILVGVSLTAFSNMAFVLSIGFAVEYSVHVVHRFISAPNTLASAHDRVVHTMKFLTMPLTLSFLSSTIGIICLAFTEFKFNEVYFFRPLLIVMLVTYFIGTWFLPILLTKLDFDILKVGSSDDNHANDFDDVKK